MNKHKERLLTQWVADADKLLLAGDYTSQQMLKLLGELDGIGTNQNIKMAVSSVKHHTAGTQGQGEPDDRMIAVQDFLVLRGLVANFITRCRI